METDFAHYRHGVSAVEVKEFHKSCRLCHPSPWLGAELELVPWRWKTLYYFSWSSWANILSLRVVAQGDQSGAEAELISQGLSFITWPHYIEHNLGGLCWLTWCYIQHFSRCRREQAAFSTVSAGPGEAYSSSGIYPWPVTTMWDDLSTSTLTAGLLFTLCWLAWFLKILF